MDADHYLSEIAAAIADRARARMVCALLDGRARTATELAALAEISPSTASTHLKKLEEARFVVCAPAGKHRYFRLSGQPAASALESLLQLSGRKLPPFRPSTPDHLRFARTCYDHAAGEIAVRLNDWLLKKDWISPNGDDEYTLNPNGQAGLARWGVDLSTPPRRRRFAYPCLDWSERRYHLGGSLGAALLEALEAKGWLKRQPGSRALDLTRTGRQAFARLEI